MCVPRKCNGVRCNVCLCATIYFVEFSGRDDGFTLFSVGNLLCGVAVQRHLMYGFGGDWFNTSPHVS